MKKILFGIVAFILFNVFISEAQPCVAPVIQISASGNNNCEGGRMTLIINVNDPNGPHGTFLWKRYNGPLPDGVPTVVTTDPFAVVEHFYKPDNGKYKVVYTDTNGCVSRDSLMLNVIAAPKPYISQAIHCYGIVLNAEDSFPANQPYTYSWLESGAVMKSMTYSGSGGPGSNQTVTITNSKGCSAQVNTFELFQIPLQVQITGRKKINPGDSTMLTAVSNYQVKAYRWYKSNSYLTGKNTVNLTVKDTGSYRVRVTTFENCILNKFATVSFKAAVLKLQQEEGSVELSVYPDPATEEIQIEGLEPGECRIFDLTGRLVKTFNTDGPLEKIAVSELMPGLYLIRSGDQSIRFMKQ